MSDVRYLSLARACRGLARSTFRRKSNHEEREVQRKLRPELKPSARIPGYVNARFRSRWLGLRDNYRDSLGYGAVMSYGQDGKPGGAGDDRDLQVRFPSAANANWNAQAGLGLKQPEIRP